MEIRIRKSSLAGRVAIPASKSHTIRAVAVAAMAEGTSTIHRPLISGDALSAVRCYRALGASIDISNEEAWIIKGCGGIVQEPSDVIDVGNSGTTLRLAMASAALSRPGTRIAMTGDAQIQARPVAPLIEAINSLGGRCRSVRGNGSAPVEVAGTLRGGRIAIECKTSQYLSSLLLATPLADGDTEIDVTLLNEPDYVRMTMDWLDRQNIRYEHDELRRFRIAGGQRYKAFDSPIPADFSSATFFLCAAAIAGGKVTLEGLDFNDSQPDKAVVDYLRQMGAEVTIDGDKVTVQGGQLRGIEIDMNRTPDALPAMAVTAAFAQGQTRLVNVPQARMKETDRIACMAAELNKVGIETRELPDGLIISGGRCRSTAVSGHGDHRIVMAMAVAALAGEGEMTVDTAEAMDVTFPGFVQLMRSLGADIEVIV